MTNKIYVRKTLDGAHVLASNFTDLTPEQLAELIAAKENYDALESKHNELIDLVDSVTSYAASNPMSAPQCVLDLAEELEED
ncbi:hypothetical protein [Vibrio crassostreae]|uniref:hypothetical protein n=1 Tax=Vibrio crassostreae TaxID=246167 RepID=UPI001B3011CB|nr:hypothetical protein [Vibrio crassostreae]